MATSKQYYCVGCGKTEMLERAHLLFHTGFYRVVHPLGCCTDCAVEKPQALGSPVSAKEEADAGRLPGDYDESDRYALIT